MAQSDHTTTIIVGDDLVPRLSIATVLDLREIIACLYNPQEYGLSSSYDVQSVLAAEATGDGEQLVHIHTAVRRVARRSGNRFFPAGRLIQLSCGRVPQLIDQDSVDDLVISKDMVTAHMPHQYLAALREASLTSEE